MFQQLRKIDIPDFDTLDQVLKYNELLTYILTDLNDYIKQYKINVYLGDIYYDNFPLYVQCSFVHTKLISIKYDDLYYSFLRFIKKEYPNHLIGDESYLNKIPFLVEEDFKLRNQIKIIYQIDPVRINKIILKRKLNILIE